MLSQFTRRLTFQLYLRPSLAAVCSSNNWTQKRVVTLKHENNRIHSPISCIRYVSTSYVRCKEVSLRDKITQELSVFKTIDFSQLKCAPSPALIYGFGGIIPFVFPPIYFVLGSFSPFLATAQLMYGATILAFVGGVKWGSALAKDDVSHEQIGISTIPSLVAWSSLLVPEPLGILVVSCGLVGALYVDLMSSRYPPWFFALRSTLTGVAATSLIITLFCHVLH